MTDSSSYDKIARSEASKTNPFDPNSRAAYRAYNNYFKAAQIRHVLSAAQWTTKTCPEGLAVLDLASGRGGDLAKILVKSKSQHIPVTVYAALDISKDSVAEAKRRFETMSTNPRTAQTFGLDGKAPQTLIDVANVFDTEKTWKEHMALTTRKFQVVVMQFALHYGCKCVETLSSFLKCVSDVLVDDGFFCGTTVDYENGLKKKVARQQQKEETKNRNSHFKVTLQDPEKDTPRLLADNDVVIGVPYRFQIDELVDDVEYSIPTSILKEEAEKVGLICVECENLYETNGGKYKNGYIPDGNIRPELGEGDIELISFYIGFVFQKKKK